MLFQFVYLLPHLLCLISIYTKTIIFDLIPFLVRSTRDIQKKVIYSYDSTIYGLWITTWSLELQQSFDLWLIFSQFMIKWCQGSLWTGVCSTSNMGYSEYIWRYTKSFCTRQKREETAKFGQCVFPSIRSTKN